MLDILVSGGIRKVPIESEEDLRNLWNQEVLYKLAPVDMTIKGAALATSLEGVFIAGYQATLNHLFPKKDFRGWSAFLFSEKSEDSSNISSTSLINTESGLILSGFKSWVAQSRLVDRLIVTVRSEKSYSSKIGGVVVNRNRMGVKIVNWESPKFLKNMSQGSAVFDNVLTSEDETFNRHLIRDFGGMESHFMVLAIMSFLISCLIISPNKLLAELIVVCEKYIRILRRLDEDEVAELNKLKITVRKLIDEFFLINRRYYLKWEQDKTFFYMYLS